MIRAGARSACLFRIRHRAHQRLKQTFQKVFDRIFVSLDLLGTVDARHILLEKFFHGHARLVGKTDLVFIQTVMDQVADQCVNDLGIVRSQLGLDRRRDILEFHDAGHAGVFDISSDISDLIGDPYDTSFQSGRK